MFSGIAAWADCPLGWMVGKRSDSGVVGRRRGFGSAGWESVGDGC